MSFSLLEGFFTTFQLRVRERPYEAEYRGIKIIGIDSPGCREWRLQVQTNGYIEDWVLLYIGNEYEALTAGEIATLCGFLPNEDLKGWCLMDIEDKKFLYWKSNLAIRMGEQNSLYIICQLDIENLNVLSVHEERYISMVKQELANY